MIIIPAIDLKDGKVVRLLRGDYKKMTVYGDNPLETGIRFEKEGAKFLHLVDLDGAKEGFSLNSDVIRNIVENTNLPVEIGGGIRTEERIKEYLDAGASRVILGTVVVKNPDFTHKMIDKYGSRIALGIDLNENFASVNGWTETTKVSVDDILKPLENKKNITVICTDISKDGAMNGTNVELYKRLQNKYDVNIVASGGVSSLEDIRALKDIGIYGAIIGKAIYTGAIDLSEAVSEAQNDN